VGIKSHLRELSEQATANVTQPNGRLHVGDAETELFRLVDLDPRRDELHKALLSGGCKGEIRKFGERHRPKRDKDGRFIYSPRDIWKLGDGLWVWAAMATPVDGIAAARQSARNRGQIDSADDQFQQYMTQRLDAFRLSPNIATFGDLERIHFGYTEDPDADPDFEAGAA
jgi:hypothetical protein